MEKVILNKLGNSLPISKETPDNLLPSIEKNFKEILTSLNNVQNASPSNQNEIVENNFNRTTQEIENLKKSFNENITSFNKTLDEICQTQIDILKNLHENN